jgi:hypothetical protein
MVRIWVLNLAHGFIDIMVIHSPTSSFQRIASFLGSYVQYNCPWIMFSSLIILLQKHVEVQKNSCATFCNMFRWSSYGSLIGIHPFFINNFKMVMNFFLVLWWFIIWWIWDYQACTWVTHLITNFSLSSNSMLSLPNEP